MLPPVSGKTALKVLLKSLENVMLPMDFSNAILERKRLGRALGILEQVGIREQADKLPSLLSGGQQQRAAIVRALANDPGVRFSSPKFLNMTAVINDYGHYVSRRKRPVPA